MNQSGLDRQEKRLRTFYDFFAYLRSYVNALRELSPAETDAARTKLVSMLAERMRPVLRAQLAFVGYQDSQVKTSDWVSVVKESIQVEDTALLNSALIRRFDELEWRLPYSQLAAIPQGRSTLLFDQGLKRCPEVLCGLVSALAMSRVVLSGREYFLFICDTQEGPLDGYPRFDNFDGVMLAVASGILEVGFRSGVRRGQDIEEELTQQFLRELVHELKIPIQAVLADASNLQAEIPPGLEDLRAMAARNVQGARDLGRLIDNMRIVLFENRMPTEPLVLRSLKEPLEAAIEIVTGEAQVKGLAILEPDPIDGQPFPVLPLYFRDLTTAFKNILHNAVAYSLPVEGEYRPVRIVGRGLGDDRYKVEISNYGVEITPQEITERRLFDYRYRGTRARELVASGAGLGLATAQRIVDNHQGVLTVTSRPVTPRVSHNTFGIVLPTEGSPLKESGL